MESHQPTSANGGGASVTTSCVREGATTAHAQKSLLQLLARIIAKAWRETHGKTRQPDGGGPADGSSPVSRDSPDGVQ